MVKEHYIEGHCCPYTGKWCHKCIAFEEIEGSPYCNAIKTYIRK